MNLSCLFVVLFLTSNIFAEHSQLHQMLRAYFSYERIKFCYFINVKSDADFIENLHRKNIRTAFVAVRSMLNTSFDHTLNTALIFSCNENNINQLDLILEKNAKTKIIVYFDSAQTFKNSRQNFTLEQSFPSYDKLNFILRIQKGFQILRFYKKGQCNEFRNVGFWSNDTFQMAQVSLYKESLNSMGDILLKCYCSECQVTTKNFSPEKLMEYFQFEIFLLLKQIHSFKYSTMSASYDIKSNHSKVVQRFIETNSDIIISGILQTQNVKRVDFLMPFFELNSCFFILRPQKSSLTISKPFSLETWETMLVVSILIVVVLKIALSVSEADDTSWIFSVLTVFSTICQDGDDPSPEFRDLGCKFTFFVLLITSLLLFNYYTSSMVAILLNNEVKDEITINDLTQSSYEIGIDNDTYVKNWIGDAHFSNVQHLKNAKKLTAIYSPLEGIAKVGQGSFAYYTNLYLGHFYAGKIFDQKQVCSFSEVSMIPKVLGGLALRKKSKFVEIFKISLLKMNQNGLIHRLKMKWKVEKVECYMNNNRFIPLGMQENLVAVLCLLLSCLISVAILLVEMAWKGGSRMVKITV